MSGRRGRLLRRMSTRLPSLTSAGCEKPLHTPDKDSLRLHTRHPRCNLPNPSLTRRSVAYPEVALFVEGNSIGSWCSSDKDLRGRFELRSKDIDLPAVKSAIKRLPISSNAMPAGCMLMRLIWDVPISTRGDGLVYVDFPDGAGRRAAPPVYKLRCYLRLILLWPRRSGQSCKSSILRER